MSVHIPTTKSPRDLPKAALRPADGDNKTPNGLERPPDHEKWLAEALLEAPWGTPESSPWRHLASKKRIPYTKVHKRRKGRGGEVVLALPKEVQDYQKHAFR